MLHFVTEFICSMGSMMVEKGPEIIYYPYFVILHLRIFKKNRIINLIAFLGNVTLL